MALYSCPEPLGRPSGTIIMESDVVAYLAHLEAVVVPICKQRLLDIKQIIDCYNDPKCDPGKIEPVLTREK